MKTKTPQQKQKKPTSNTLNIATNQTSQPQKMTSLMLQTSERARSPLEQMLLDGTEPNTVGASDVDPLDAYDVVSAVGRGKFSAVYKAYRKSDKTVVALKRIRMGDVGSGASTASKVLQEVR